MNEKMVLLGPKGQPKRILATVPTEAYTSTSLLQNLNPRSRVHEQSQVDRGTRLFGPEGPGMPCLGFEALAKL